MTFFAFSGYVYDTESSLYYLQSRYYNVNIGRFINADAFATTGQGLLGNNMFAYCNNNPINLRDITGETPLEIALDLLLKWIYGNGENQYFDDDSSIAKKLKKSKTMRATIDKEIQKFENNDSYGSDSVYFGDDGPDLWLGIRRANYEVTITKETKESGFWIFKKTQTRYVVQVKVADTYNFNIGNETGDGLGSVLNNLGYWAQENELGNEYEWEVTYVYTTEWK